MSLSSETWLDEFMSLQQTLLGLKGNDIPAVGLMIADSGSLGSADGIASLVDLIETSARCRTRSISLYAKLCHVLTIVLGHQSRESDAINFRTALFDSLFPQYRVARFDRSQLSLVYCLFRESVFPLDQIEVGFGRLIRGTRLVMTNPKPNLVDNDIHLYLFGLAIYFGKFLESGPIWQDILGLLTWFRDEQFTIDLKRIDGELAAVRANGWAPTNTTVADIIRSDNIDLLMSILSEPRANINQPLPPQVLEPSEFLQNGCSLIQAAAFCGSIRCFKYLYMNHASLDYVDDCGRVISQFAVVGGCLEIIRIVSEKKSCVAAICEAVEHHQNVVFEWIDQTLDEPLPDAQLIAVLRSAADSNNIAVFEYYRERVAELGGSLSDLLECAVRGRHYEIVAYLLPILSFPATALVGAVMEAARGESVPTMRLFFEHTPADVNWVVDGWGPIEIAARNGSLGLVKYLASLPDVNLNEPTEQGGLALHQAAAGGRVDVVAFLVTLDGIDVNARDAKGNTALHLAARGSQLDIVRILLDCPGIDAAAADERNFQTWAHIAVECEFVDALPFLLSRKDINLNQQEKHGLTVLHIALHRRNETLWRAFLECKDVDKTIESNRGWTPLHFACHCKITEAARLLLADARVDVNAVNQVGSTPLHFAVEQGAIEIVQLLCERGDIKLGEINKRMFTPLDEAIRLKDTQIAAFLEEKGAPLNREKPRQ